MNHGKISIRGFPGFAPSTEASSRTQEKNLWCQGYWSASKIYNLEYLFWIKSSRRPEIPPKDWGAFINFVARLKRWLWYSYDHSLILTLNHHDSWAAILERKKKKKKKKNEKLEKETIAVLLTVLEWYFLGQIIEPRPYWSFPIQPDIHSSLCGPVREEGICTQATSIHPLFKWTSSLESMP